MPKYLLEADFDLLLADRLDDALAKRGIQAMPVLTKASVYEHGRLVVRFTCKCGAEHSANFTKKEHFDCPDCNRRHYPALRLVTHEASTG